jgi:hypothetical protein
MPAMILGQVSPPAGPARRGVRGGDAHRGAPGPRTARPGLRGPGCADRIDVRVRDDRPVRVAFNKGFITAELHAIGVLVALVTTAMTGPLFDRWIPAAVASRDQSSAAVSSSGVDAG